MADPHWPRLQLTVQDVVKAIDRLEKEMGYPFGTGVVSALDRKEQTMGKTTVAKVAEMCGASLYTWEELLGKHGWVEDDDGIVRTCSCGTALVCNRFPFGEASCPTCGCSCKSATGHFCISSGCVTVFYFDEMDPDILAERVWLVVPNEKSRLVVKTPQPKGG